MPRTNRRRAAVTRPPLKDSVEALRSGSERLFVLNGRFRRTLDRLAGETVSLYSQNRRLRTAESRLRWRGGTLADTLNDRKKS